MIIALSILAALLFAIAGLLLFGTAWLIKLVQYVSPSAGWYGYLPGYDLGEVLRGPFLMKGSPNGHYRTVIRVKFHWKRPSGKVFKPEWHQYWK